MARILVTGADGQVGMALRDLLDPAQHDIIFTDRAELDMRDEAAIEKYALSHRPEVIINCAAYTAVDRAESELQACVEINQDAVRVLAQAAQNLQARFLHISTDYVYHNSRNRPMTELDPTEPKSVYARTKLAGEKEARAVCQQTYVLRTSWVYGRSGHNFVRTMQRLGAEKEELRVVCDQIGAPTYADDLASALAWIVEHPQIQPGTYNFANLGVTSWYDFAIAIMEAFELPCRVVPILTSEYPTPAMRPSYSVMDMTKARQAGLPNRHWREALYDFVAAQTTEKV